MRKDVTYVHSGDEVWISYFFETDTFSVKMSSQRYVADNAHVYMSLSKFL